MVRRMALRSACFRFSAGLLIALSAHAASAQTYLWDGFAENSQHTAISSVPSQSLLALRWQAMIDLDPQYSYSGVLYAHYGSPMITSGNTIVTPVKTTATGGFEVEGLNAATGSALWTVSSDYSIPPTGAWTPPYSPTMNSSGVMYLPGADGTVLEANANSAGSVSPTRLAFYGTSNYAADPSAYSNVYIDTPITTDSAGDLYFGYMVSGTPAISALGSGGIARISASGVGAYVSAATASGNSSMVKAVENCAPAISNDGSSIYIAVNSSNFSSGYLLQLNSTTLATQAAVVPMDPKTGSPALLTDDGTSSPTIGPDGDVYLGVFDDGDTSRGWMEHYSANLATTKTPGGFGWDDTVTIVPASMVPSYHGTSSYLLMTKYNNYVQTGGGGQNMIAILDPNAPVIDNQRNNGTGATIMQVVESILGPTPNSSGGVYEWCDNNAVVDPATDSILVTSEDGHLYRWNLGTNTLTQSISLGGGLGEAYTPTMIGPDGAVYALNNGVLNSVGLPITGWTGGASSAWNTTAANWTTGSPTPGSTYSDGAVLLFGNTSGNTSVMIQNCGVKPGWMTFTNTGSAAGGVDYTIGGGPIDGATGITLDGSGGVGGAVILTGANSFSGGVAVNVGRLNLQNGFALGNSSGVTVAYGAALELQSNSGAPTFGLAATDSSPIPLTLAGSGIAGAGALNNVAGNNTYAGPISIGLNSGGATVGSSSTAAGDQLTLSGAIAVAPGNTLTFVGAGKTTVSGTLSLATGTALGNTALAMQGTGALTITAAPSFGDSSAIAATSGVLEFNVASGNATIGNGVVATVAAGAALQLAGTTSALSDPNSGNTVSVVNNSSNAGGGLSVVGSNQQVGVVSGSGDTVVGDGTHPASLTATQILQNALIVNAGSTVTINPTGTLPATAMASSLMASSLMAGAGSSSATIASALGDAGDSDADSTDSSSSDADSIGAALLGVIQTAIDSQSIAGARGLLLEHRVLAFEQIAADDPGLNVAPLENSAVQSILFSSNDSTSVSEQLLGNTEIDTLLRSDSELALGATAVPEPCALLLLVLGGLTLAIGPLRRRLSSGRHLPPLAIVE